MTITLFIIILFALIVINVPIAFALGISSLFYLIVSHQPQIIMAQRLFSGANSFSLVALPLFVLTGEIMNYAGISSRLINLGYALVGHVKGGMSLVNVLTGMFFAGVSGSAVADTAAIGSVLIPAMKEKGYPLDHAAAITSASGTIGIIIPPSIPMVIHASVAGLSIATLFIAGIVPGILVGLGMMVASYIIAKRDNYPRESSFSFRRLLLALWQALPALMLPGVIMGGIVFGICSPTEAGAIAAVYAFILGFVLNRKQLMSKMYRILVDTSIMTAIVMVIISMSSLMGWVLTINNVPQHITTWFSTLTSNPLQLTFLLAALLVVAGTMFHGAPIQTIIVPMLIPLVNKVGVNPIVFAMVVILTVGLGQQTPPVGSALYVASAISGLDIMKITKANIPFLAVIVAVTILVILVPGVSTILPHLLQQ